MTACLGLVTPVGAQSPSGGSAYAPGDGAPTRAACAALGFEIYKEPVNIYQRFPQPMVQRETSSFSHAGAPPPAPPLPSGAAAPARACLPSAKKLAAST